MPTYEVTGDLGEAAAPVLIVSFQDWVDAGTAGSKAARRIADGGDVVVDFDSDTVFDYRSHRPVLDIVDGRPTEFAWPRLTITRRRAGERDLFVLTGPEPDARWRQFGADVLELALRIGIVEHVSLGAIPTSVPHTVAPPVMMTASRPELLAGQNAVEGLLRVPAAAVSLVEWTMSTNGIPAVGFWAQVPHYAAPYTAGAIALIRRVESHLSVEIGAGVLEEEAARQAKALQEAFASNPEAQAYLERLDSLMGGPDPGESGIAEEVERYLRSRRGEGGPGPFGS